MPSTYGFDGSTPTQAVDPGVTAQSVKTGTGQADDYLFGTLSNMRNTAIRGQSPSNGLGVVPTFDAAFSGSRIDYSQNMVPTGSGTSNTLDGPWPIQYDPFPSIQAKRLPDDPTQTDYTGNKVGDG